MTSQKLELYVFTRQTGRKKTHEKALGNYKVTRAKGFQFTSLVHKIYSILYQLALLYPIVNTHYALLYFSCQKTSTTMMNTWHCPCADTSSGSATLIEILYLFPKITCLLAWYSLQRVVHSLHFCMLFF